MRVDNLRLFLQVERLLMVLNSGLGELAMIVLGVVRVQSLRIWVANESVNAAGLASALVPSWQSLDCYENRNTHTKFVRRENGRWVIRIIRFFHKGVKMRTDIAFKDKYLHGVFFQIEVVGALVSRPSSPWNSPNFLGCSRLALKFNFLADFDRF